MIGNPVFSIIIPTCNSEATITKCIDSILNQSFPEFEILIIDGDSDDSSLSILEGYKDSRLKITSEPDQGIYDAMNKGIRLAKGKWFYFLGSDDSLYDPTVLNVVFEKICKEDIDIIYGNVMMVNCVYDGPFDFTKIQSRNICHQAIFYSNKVLFELGGYNLKYNVFSDYDLNLKWFFDKKYKSTYIDKVIANYSSTGFSSNNHDDFYEDLSSKMIRLGIRELKVNELKLHALSASIVSYSRHQYFDWFYFKSLYYFFRIIDFAQRRLFAPYK